MYGSVISFSFRTCMTTTTTFFSSYCLSSVNQDLVLHLRNNEYNHFTIFLLVLFQYFFLSPKSSRQADTSVPESELTRLEYFRL